MPTTRNGDVEIYYETFGDAIEPTLVLVNGLASQCLNYDEQWCEKFAVQGFQVIRFDNRDTGVSTKCETIPYTLADMANDVIAVLDAVGVEHAHVMGLSMGGMIVQLLAIDHADRLLTMTSVMSRTGEPGYGESSPEALAQLTPTGVQPRADYIESQIEALGIYGSKPEWIDEPYIRARSGAAYDRSYCPAGVARQILALIGNGSRADALRTITVPTLVMHGDRDTLIDPSGGRRTAELISGARYVEIEGMGHDYPSVVWDRWVAIWADFVRDVTSV